MWKEADIVYFMVLSKHLKLEIFSQDSQTPGQDLNTVLPKCEERALTSTLLCLAPYSKTLFTDFLYHRNV